MGIWPQIGVAILASAVFAASGFAQVNKNKFIISGTAERNERPVAKTAVGRKIAIVIAVSTLDDKNQAELPFVENDARRMVETLVAEGFAVWPLCEKNVPLPTNVAKRRKTPTKANIEETVEKTLENQITSENDVLLVYFSGHGVESAKRKNETLLFARDSDSQDFDGTCVSATRLRNLVASSGAKRCLLALDSCCAGGTRSALPKYYENVAHFVEGGTAGVATFAACAVDEESGCWDPLVEDPNDVADDGREHAVSTFTYWLNAGLKGFADGAIDGKADGQIRSDELFVYVDENVAFQKKNIGLNAEQTATVVAKRDEVPFVLCDVAPMERYEALAAVVKQIVTKARFLKKKTVDLTVESVENEDFSDAKSVDELKSFAQVAKNYLNREIDGLMASAVKKNRDETATGSVDVAATVELTSRSVVDEEGETKDVVEFLVTCRFDGAEIEGKAGEIKARVSLEDSGATLENPTTPPNARPIASDPASAPAQASVSTPFPSSNARPIASDSASEPAPASVSTPFATPNVRIEARPVGSGVWTTRPIYRTTDGANWVELNPGENYRIIVERSALPGNPAEVGFRLLIDGRNTLPQPEPVLYVATRSAREKSERKSVVGPVVALDEARWWRLTLAEGGVYDGFYTELQEAGGVYAAKRDEFVVVSVDEIGGATDWNGLIDVAFYDLLPLEATRDGSDVGTVGGVKRGTTLKRFVPKALGPELAGFRLRYASAARLAASDVGASGLAAEPTFETSATRAARPTKGTTDNNREAASGGVWR